MTDLLLEQLTEPFRIGLIIALVLTTLRNVAVTGTLVPLACGVVFVAVIIPVTMQGGVDATRIGVGIVANLIILGIVMAIRALILRLRA